MTAIYSPHSHQSCEEELNPNANFQLMRVMLFTIFRVGLFSTCLFVSLYINIKNREGKGRKSGQK